MAAREWLPATVRLAAIDHKLKAGEPLFRAGDRTLGLWEVTAGRVRLARVDRAGHEIVLHVAGPGETLAEASLYSPQYHCDAIANTDAIVRLYPKRDMLTAFEENPKAARAFTVNGTKQTSQSRPSQFRSAMSANVSAFMARAVGERCSGAASCT